MDINKLIMVGIGGFAGSVSRYMVSLWSAELIRTQFIPYGTLIVNVAGCLMIGFLGGLLETRAIFTPEVRALVLIGFLGGFTTYSTFGYELLTIFRQGEMAAVFTHLVLHLVLGLGAVFFGFSLSKMV